METIHELRQRRAAQVERMREILDESEAENRDLTGEENQEYDRLEASVDQLGVRIRRLEEQRERERTLEALTEPHVGDGGIDPRLARAAGASGDEERAEYRRVFDRYLRRGLSELDRDERMLLRSGYDDSVETRDQAKGSGAAGGFVVPTGFQAQIVEFLIHAGTARRVGTTQIVTDGGEDLPIPKVTAHGAASWVAEAGAISAADETFAQGTLKAYKAVRLVKCSVELLEDAAVDLEAYLARAIGLSIGTLENTGYYVGDGSGKPTGLLAASGGTSAGVTTASTTAVTADELIDLLHSLAPPYRRNGVFVFSDSAVKAIRKLKDTEGVYLWQPGLAAGDPDTLLGRRVETDPDIPAYGTTGNKFGLFGDFGGYVIRDVGRNGPPRGESTGDVGAFAVRRLDERYADNLQVGFLAYHRTDGLLIDTTAVKHIAHA